MTSCFQRNLFEFSMSFYIYVDIIFCLGEGVPKICNRLGGKIKKFVPVGSLFLEHVWYNRKKDLSKIPSIDIIDFNSQIINFKHNTFVFAVPHQKLCYRNFVQFPLNEILPEWKHPKTKEKISTLIEKLHVEDRKSILKVKKN